MPSPKPKVLQGIVDTVTTRRPLQDFRPFLFGDEGIVPRAADLSKLDIVGQLPGGEDRVAPFNPFQSSFFGNALLTGLFGDPNTNVGGNFLRNILGQTAFDNPFTNALVNRAQGDIVDQFNLQTAPALAARSRFSGSADNTGLQELGFFNRFSTERALGDVRASAANQFLGQQLGAAGLAPGFATSNLQQQANLLNAGNIIQNRGQLVRDVDFQNLLSQFNIPSQQLGFLGNILNQAGLQNFGQTTTQGTMPAGVTQGRNSFLSGLSGVTGLLGSFGRLAPFLFGASSRNFKMGIEDAEPVLDKLANLEIKKWKYKPGMELGDDWHIGPMAEDFQKVFGVGNGVTIDMIDVAGIALSALKEIQQKLERLQ